MSSEVPYSSSSEEAVLLDGIAKWLARESSPHATELEHNDTYPLEMGEQMKEMGLGYGCLVGFSGTVSDVDTSADYTESSMNGFFNSGSEHEYIPNAKKTRK